MAISLLNSASTNGTGSSAGLSCDAGAGPHRVAYLIVCNQGAGNFPDGDVTYGGVAMTQVEAIVSTGTDTAAHRQTIYRLVNPASGTNSFTVSSFNVSVEYIVHGLVFGGVSSADPDRTTTENSLGSDVGAGSSDEISLTPDSEVGDVILVSWAGTATSTPGTPTYGTGLTEQENASQSATRCAVATKAGAATTTTVAITGNGTKSMIAFAIAPSLFTTKVMLL